MHLTGVLINIVLAAGTLVNVAANPYNRDDHLLVARQGPLMELATKKLAGKIATGGLLRQVTSPQLRSPISSIARQFSTSNNNRNSAGLRGSQEGSESQSIQRFINPPPRNNFNQLQYPQSLNSPSQAKVDAAIASIRKNPSAVTQACLHGITGLGMTGLSCLNPTLNKELHDEPVGHKNLPVVQSQSQAGQSPPRTWQDPKPEKSDAYFVKVRGDIKKASVRFDQTDPGRRWVFHSGLDGKAPELADSMGLGTLEKMISRARLDASGKGSTEFADTLAQFDVPLKDYVADHRGKEDDWKACWAVSSNQLAESIVPTIMKDGTGKSHPVVVLLTTARGPAPWSFYTNIEKIVLKRRGFQVHRVFASNGKTIQQVWSEQSRMSYDELVRLGVIDVL